MKRILLLTLLCVTAWTLAAQAPTGVISGKIVGVDGKPAAGIRVAAASPDVTGQITAETLVAITTTDATGQYRIENLPPGRYGIIAGAVGSPTYFPGVADNAEAKVMTIAPGLTTAGLNFTLALSPTAPPQAPDNVSAFGQLVPYSPPAIRIRVLSEGVLPPGFFGNLQLTYTATGSASATPVLTGIAPVAASHGGSAPVSQDGVLSLPLPPPDNYELSIVRRDGKPLDGYQMKSITLGNTDLLKDKLKVTGPVSGEIVITLAPVP